MAYDKADSQRRYWEKRKDHPDARFIRSRVWRDGLRLAQLNAFPLCQFCLLLGKLVSADQVDHRVVPNGDEALQCDPDNLRSLFAVCHGRKTRAQGRKDKLLVIGIDPNSGWTIKVNIETGEIV
jgi:5-methylcytosine-specific restriction endonuclease McrA